MATTVRRQKQQRPTEFDSAVQREADELRGELESARREELSKMEQEGRKWVESWLRRNPGKKI